MSDGRSPRLSVIGTGYLGAVHATAMASLGFDVVGIDVDAARTESLRSGNAPFFEPGFDGLLKQTMAAGSLTWSVDFSEVADCDLHFVCVGTPQLPESHGADLQFVDAAVRELVPYLKAGAVVVGKSTVPVGTASRLSAEIRRSWSGHGKQPSVAWNPEFLREGFAVQDTLRPDRIVIGVDGGEDGGQAEEAMRQVYSAMVSAGTPVIVCDFATAELVKVAANAFLATKISFINAMAEICEVVGGDVAVLADAIGHDPRIGRQFLGAGVGFGGGCLPKDIRAFSSRAGELGVDQALMFLREVDDINARRRDRAYQIAQSLVGGDFRGRRVAVLGASFKPDSDDVRDSPALEIAARIHNAGADLVVHDPKALANARLRFPTLAYQVDLDSALHGAEVVLLLTEWREYVELDPCRTAELVATPAILDGRNALASRAWRAAGWTFRGMGREHGTVPREGAGHPGDEAR